MIDYSKYTLMCDFYELTMAHGYFHSPYRDQVCYFDMFFRTIPDEAGFAIFAGLESVVNYVQALRFTAEDLEYLRSLGVFSEDFLEYLKDFKFQGDIFAMPEGTPVFPNEPIITVRATAIEAQLLETCLLAFVNHQSLIATKANRIVRAANGRDVSEFGARRAHGPGAATFGGRAAYLAGCSSTSCTLTGRLFGAPVSGTMAHSWVQLFPTEYEAFAKYCELYPDATVLLIDTYDTLKSGLVNAIKAFDNVLKPLGKRPLGVRLDSGDLSYLSKKIRKSLDQAGYPDCKIIASNSLDETIITELLRQDAKLDSFGVGERLSTSRSHPVFDGVYKLVAVEVDGKVIPKIKISENVEKITTPHFKSVYRIFDNETHHAQADLICIHDEVIDASQPLTIFDEKSPWKRKTFEDYTIQKLQVPIIKAGKLVYQLPSLAEVRDYCLASVDYLWDEVKRFEFAHQYYVDLSQKLWDLKYQMITDEE